MKEITTIDLFGYYVGYWIVKLKLDEKYKFIVKKDNRINCYAYIQPKDHQTYYLKFNAKRLKSKWKIIHVILHELAHIIYDLRTGSDSEHEFQAEYFALKIAKEYYPQYYQKMVNWTINALNKKETGKIHREGYIKALKKLKEL